MAINIADSSIENLAHIEPDYLQYYSSRKTEIILKLVTL